MDNNYLVKCNDTVNGKYTEIEVSKEVYDYLRRSYWNEEKKEKNRMKKEIFIDETNKFDYLMVENRNIELGKDVLELMVQLELEQELLQIIYNSLTKEQIRTMILVDYYNLSYMSASKLLGISKSAVHQRVIKIHKILQEKLGKFNKYKNI